MDNQKSDADYESKFERELADLINKYSKENGSDTPDFVLAEYLNNCLANFDYAVRYRWSTKHPGENWTPARASSVAAPTQQEQTKGKEVWT